MIPQCIAKNITEEKKVLLKTRTVLRVCNLYIIY